MGLLSFIKTAGSKLFGMGDSPIEKAQKIMDHLNSFQLSTSQMQVNVDDETVKLTGNVPTVFDKIRIVATAGNVEGISAVDDDALFVGEKLDVNLEETPVEPEKTYYTVIKGDSLSKIAKHFYGDMMKYPIIFEANKPMLTHPDKIYPGQMLVIPPSGYSSNLG